MSDIPAPIIRLELDHMRHTLIHAMGRHFAEMDETVQVAINRAIDTFDYAGKIDQIVHGAIADALATAIKEHFSYGGDGYTDIREFAVSVLKDRLTVPEDDLPGDVKEILVEVEVEVEVEIEDKDDGEFRPR